jgi:Predicted transcriptional regulator with C-terminal CBS domains
MTIHEKIKECRLKLGLTQTELAERTGYTDRSSIAKIEAGKVDIPQSKIKLFAQVLRTTPAYLMGYDLVEWRPDVYYDFQHAHSAKERLEIIKQCGLDERALEFYSEQMSLLDPSGKTEMILSSSERSLILAYRRADTGTRAAVEKLLDLNTVPAQPRDA